MLGIHFNVTISAPALEAAIHQLGDRLMATIQEATAAVQAAADALEATNTKADALIQAVIDLRNAGGATPAELDAIVTLGQGMKSSADAQSAEDDATLGG